MATDRVLPPLDLRRGEGPGSPVAGSPVAGSPVAGSPVAGSADTAAPATGPSAGRPVPVPSRWAFTASASAAVAAGPSAVARLAKPRGDAVWSTATRAGLLIGVSAALYAGSLATVAGLEATTQAQAAADAQPALDALARAKAENDQIDAAVKAADARLQALSSDYNTTSSDMSAYEAQFQQLSTLVAKIEGSAAAMNANFKLPTVTMRGAIGGGGGGSSVVTITAASGKP